MYVYPDNSRNWLHKTLRKLITMEVQSNILKNDLQNITLLAKIEVTFLCSEFLMVYYYQR